MERENASTVVEDFLVEDKRAQTDSKKIWRKEDRFLPWIPLRHKMTEPVYFVGLMANVSRLARLWQDLRCWIDSYFLLKIQNDIRFSLLKTSIGLLFLFHFDIQIIR